MPNSQKVISKIDTRGKNNLFENSFINSFLLTSQTDTNDKKLQNNGNNLKNNKKEYDTEEKGNIFKRTSLKSTIIVDNNGNHSLDLKQKKIINDYFQKVNINTKINAKNFIRPKIRKMTTQININNNNKILNTFKKMKSSTIVNNQKTIKFNRKIKKALTIKNINYNFKNNIKNQLKKKGNTIQDKNKTKSKKMESYNKLYDFFFIKCEKFNILNKNLRINEVESDDNSNSLFENNSSSFDSSFLGSSIDNDFYQNLNK